MPEASFNHPLFGKVRFRTNNPSVWIRGDGISFISGFDVDDITTMVIPQLAGIPGSNHGKLQFHKRAHDQLLMAFADVERLGLLQHIKTCAGSLNFRLRKPTSGALSKLPSNHAFGIAIDLNADDGSNGASVAPVAPVFEALGFKWGISFADPMHFEVEEFVTRPDSVSAALSAHLKGSEPDFPVASMSASISAPSSTLISSLSVADVSAASASVRNAYPELPELPFERTSVGMSDVETYMSGIHVPAAVKRACYVIFRNESARGTKGINNNYIGLQADGGRQSEKWTPFIAGTCVHAENMTGRLRRFVCLRDWRTCIDILAEKISLRGLYVGGYSHPYANMQVNTEHDWPLAYWREWVQGDSHAQIPAAEMNGLLAQYELAVSKFP
jgi:hypothetical protein